VPLPFGSEVAAAIAAACGRPQVAEKLGELLGESLDPDEEIESERLGTCCGCWHCRCGW
jgi:hypothetical protein